ncbi:MAG: sigma-70 family RNA polymerase sigma factor [Chloroflexi bacterium]|nr:MAG: sigma-70 family RNA polymerase sigma factor [Chloroflexota bacterium]
MDDAQAVRFLKQGDLGGLEWLITCYQVRAIRAAYLITHNEAMAEDVVQEAFIQFFRNVHQFDESRPFQPYFLRSVVNRAINTVHREAKVTGLEREEDAAEVEYLLTQASQVETQVEYNQLKAELLQAMAKLTPRQRAVIIQRYYLEMSEKEMAQNLKIAPGTIKWLLNAAKARLRTMLKSDRSQA